MHIPGYKAGRGKIISPGQIRTGVHGSKARGPWPLDDGTAEGHYSIYVA